jgi:hypothetical protein
MNAEEQTYTFIEEISRVVVEWLASKGVVLEDLQKISTEHSTKIASLETDTEDLKASTTQLTEDLSVLDSRVTPIEKGGTGANDAKEALSNLGILNPDACDYRLIKTMETGDFTVEVPKDSAYHVIPLTDFDALEYDELIFVANGNVTMSKNESSDRVYSVHVYISPYNPIGEIYRNVDMTLCTISQNKSEENGWQDVTIPIKNSCVRCMRLSAIGASVNKEGSVSYDTETTFVSMGSGESFGLKDRKFYLSIFAETNSLSQSYAITGNMRIDIYGRKSIFNSNKEE